MYKDLDNKTYDFVIFGTSLTESILSSYLAKSGKKILHLDLSKYYGGDCKNFSYKDLDSFLNELKENLVQDPHLQNIKLISEKYEVEEFAKKEKIREYNFDFNPKLTFSKSKTTDELSSTRASSYMEFMSVKQIFLHHVDKFLSTPCSKSEIFVSNQIALIEKQKLLNFIYAVMKVKNKILDVNTTVEFKKDNEVDNAIYEDVMKNLNNSADEFLSSRFSPLLQKIIKLTMGNVDPNTEFNPEFTLDNLCETVYKYLNSLSVYGATPFIIPLYGSSEFSQAMSRMSSVYGTVFIVNDSLTVECGINNEYYVDNTNSYFIIKIHDKNVDESFYVRTDKIICNENFISLLYKKESKVAFHGDVLSHVEKNFIDECTVKKMQQFICFYVIENDTRLRNTSCPIIYKVQKNDEYFKNEYGFTAYEFDQNSCSSPKLRSILQIVITCFINEDESVFVEKSKTVCENFIKRHVENVVQEINTVVGQPDKMNDETRDYFDKIKDTLNPEVKLLSTFQFYRNIHQSKYEDLPDNQSGKLIITRNNYYDNDVDFYYEECERILKNEKWENLNSLDINNNEVQGSHDMTDDNENLIDEIFDLILEDKK